MNKCAGTLGFLGFGNMGLAIAAGLLDRKVYPAKRILVFDPESVRQAAAREMGLRVMDTPRELAAAADTLMFAVKPQVWRAAAESLASALREDALVLSIMAGVPIAALRAALGGKAKVIRVMPNTPAMVRAGAAGIAPGPGCDDTDADLARTIFEAVGIAEIVKEKDLDAITALSGSGPAYFFLLVECLTKAAVAEGLDGAVAARLAAQTALGAGRLLAESGAPASVLRERVTSKGGTTFAALETFRARNFEETVLAAVKAAAARSRELGK